MTPRICSRPLPHMAFGTEGSCHKRLDFVSISYVIYTSKSKRRRLAKPPCASAGEKALCSAPPHCLCEALAELWPLSPPPVLQTRRAGQRLHDLRLLAEPPAQRELRELFEQAPELLPCCGGKSSCKFCSSACTSAVSLGSSKDTQSVKICSWWGQKRNMQAQ